MKNFYFVPAIFVGIAIAVLSATALSTLEWTYVLLVWAASGATLGALTGDHRSAMWIGLLFGMFLSLTYLLLGFQGEASKFVLFAVFALALSLIGALGGLLAAEIGFWLREAAKRRR